MKKILYNIYIDLLIVLRNGFFYLLLFSGVLLVLLNTFFSKSQNLFLFNEYINDNTQNKIFQTYLRKQNLPDSMFIDNSEKLIQLIKNKKGSIGIIINNSNNDSINIKIMSNEQISEKNFNILKASINYIYSIIKGEKLKIFSVKNLKSFKKISSKTKNIPPLVLLEVISLGFFFLPVLMFDEKKDRIIQVLNVSPLSSFDYIISKLLLFLILSIFYAFFIILICFESINFLHYLIIIIISSILLILTGLLTGIFSNNLSQWLVYGIIIMLIVFFPIISYFLPHLNSIFIKIIPSYSMMYLLKEIIVYKSPKINNFHMFILLCEDIFLFIVSYFVVKIKLFGKNK